MDALMLRAFSPGSGALVAVTSTLLRALARLVVIAYALVGGVSNAVLRGRPCPHITKGRPSRLHVTLQT
jgi:hypothetical protein